MKMTHLFERALRISRKMVEANSPLNGSFFEPFNSNKEIYFFSEKTLFNPRDLVDDLAGLGRRDFLLHTTLYLEIHLD